MIRELEAESWNTPAEIYIGNLQSAVSLSI